MSKLQLVGYALMIVAYVLDLYDKRGFAVTAVVLGVFLIVAAFISKRQRKRKSSQSVGNGAQANGDIVFRNIEQSANASESSQSVGNGAQANGDITYGDIKQK